MSDLEVYCLMVEYIVEVVCVIVDGWFLGFKKKFGYFNIVKGVFFIIGKDMSKFMDFLNMCYYYGVLGGGVVIKLCFEVLIVDVMVVLEGIDFDSLN